MKKQLLNDEFENETKQSYYFLNSEDNTGNQWKKVNYYVLLIKQELMNNKVSISHVHVLIWSFTDNMEDRKGTKNHEIYM